MKITVFVLPDGSVVSRYSDLLVVQGKLEPERVKRVTNVEWSPKLEMWLASTLTSKAIICARSRKLCLEMEGEFVDKLLAQLYLCRKDDGMWCPECNAALGDDILPNCHACGCAFPMAQEGFKWSDFMLDHLYANKIPKEAVQKGT